MSDAPDPTLCRCNICTDARLYELPKDTGTRGMECRNCGAQDLWVCSARDMACESPQDYYAVEDNEPADWWKRERNGDAEAA